MIPAMSVEDSSAAERPLARPGPFVVLAAFGVLAVLGLALSVLRDPGLPAHVAALYMRVAGGLVVPTVRVADAADLSAQLSTSPPGDVRVPALDSAGWRLEGGTHVSLGADPAATAIYRNAVGEYLVWHALEGDVGQLPETTDVRGQDGRTYLVHYKATMVLVFWQEGPRLAVLVASLPAEHVMAVARVAAAGAAR
jgi:hypothetical protein